VARQAGGSLTEACYSIAVDASGNGYVLWGAASTNAVFGSVTLVASPTGYPDSFMAISGRCDVVWVKQIKGLREGMEEWPVEPDGTAMSQIFPDIRPLWRFGFD